MKRTKDLNDNWQSQTGAVTPKPHGGGVVAKAGTAQLPIVKALVEAQPDALLEELCKRLARKAGVEVSVSTMQRVVQSLGLSVKKKTLIASEQETQRVKDLRFAHRLWSFMIDPCNLVFLDETGMPLGFIRLYGRSPLGERVYDSEAPSDAGQNIALIGGVSLDGLIATMSIVGSVNTDVFLFYIQEILMPQLWAGSIVLMDHLSVHHAAVVREALESVGAKVVFLPLYAPDLSP